MKHLITHSPADEKFILWAADILDRIDQASLSFVQGMIPDQQFLLAVLPEIKMARPIFSDEEITILGELYDIGRTTVTVRVEVRCGDELIFRTKLVHIQVDDQWKKRPIALDIHEAHPDQSRVVRVRRRSRWSLQEDNDRHVNHVAP
jgi:acyl-CoA thioesterase FadM